MAIRIECEKCGYKYNLKDELAGKKVKCKICKAVFVVPTPVTGIACWPARPCGPPSTSTSAFPGMVRFSTFRRLFATDGSAVDWSVT